MCPCQQYLWCSTVHSGCLGSLAAPCHPWSLQTGVPCAPAIPRIGGCQLPEQIACTARLMKWQCGAGSLFYAPHSAVDDAQKQPRIVTKGPKFKTLNAWVPEIKKKLKANMVGRSLKHHRGVKTIFMPLGLGFNACQGPWNIPDPSFHWLWAVWEINMSWNC